MVNQKYVIIQNTSGKLTYVICKQTRQVNRTYVIKSMSISNLTGHQILPLTLVIKIYFSYLILIFLSFRFHLFEHKISRSMSKRKP